MRSSPLPLIASLICLLGAYLPSASHAHEVRPALLDLSEIEGSQATRFQTLWKLPRAGDATLRLFPRFPANCAYSEHPLPHVLATAFVFEGELECTEDLRGQSLEVAGLQATLTDALVRVNFASGRSFDALLRPSAPSIAIPEQNSIGVPAYLQLGFTHMLLGVDHLLFVLGLLLLIVPGTATRPAEKAFIGLEKATLLRLAAAVTSFTLAHSITLALAVLGHAKLPQTPVEAVIAMSIVLLASEIARDPKRSGFVAHNPWQMAFAFGLLHGFGFAGALSEIGLPQAQVGWALLLFNLGIEAGQLVFVACALGVYLALGGVAAGLPSFIRVAPLYAMGTVACYWVLDRISIVAF